MKAFLGIRAPHPHRGPAVTQHAIFASQFDRAARVSREAWRSAAGALAHVASCEADAAFAWCVAEECPRRRALMAGSLAFVGGIEAACAAAFFEAGGDVGVTCVRGVLAEGGGRGLARAVEAQGGDVGSVGTRCEKAETKQDEE